MSEDWWSTPAGVQSVLREEIKILKARIEELEAKLAKAVEWAKKVQEYAISWDDRYLAERSKEILAELTGGKDE